LANGRFKRDYGRSSLESIVDEYEEVLHDRSIRGWDIDGTEDDRSVKRRTLVGYCLQAGLDALVNHAEREALASLAVFPDDTDIPVSVVSDFWGQALTHGPGRNTFTSFQANALLAEFDDLSFLRTYTGAAGYIRLHDEVLAYLRTLHTPDQDQLLHQRMIQAIRRHCEGSEWHRLPSYHSYGWKHLLYHLEQGGEYETARKLRLDFQWMKSKLAATDIYELQQSYLTDESLESVLIYNALGSSFGIAKRPSSLAHQLYGQLGNSQEPGILELLGELSLDTSFWPRPSFPHLRSSKYSTTDYFGHRVVVSTVISGSNGEQFVTASADRSVRLWDAATRRQVGRSMVHPGYIVGAWLDPESSFILTACTDYSARIWGINTQEELVPAMRHVAPIRSASLDSTGKLLATASSDGTARIWSVKSGNQLIDALEHGAGVTAAKFDSSGKKLITLSSDGALSTWLTSNGELISRSISQSGPGGKIVFDSDLTHFLTYSNNTVHLWDADLTPSIKESLILDAPVRDAFFSPDGTHLCTIQSDGRVRLWHQEGKQRASYSLPHKGWVSAASFDPSGRWLVTFCSDCALNVWDVASRSCVSVVDLQASVTAWDWSGSRLILGSADGRVLMFDFPSKNFIANDNC
jgi:WD40 repeat protein